MDILLVVLVVAILTLLLFFSGYQPRPQKYSRFELERRLKLNDDSIVRTIEKNKLEQLIYSCRSIMISLLMVGMSYLLYFLFGAGRGLLFSILLALIASGLSMILWRWRPSKYAFRKAEDFSIKQMTKSNRIRHHLNKVEVGYEQTEIFSKEELTQLVDDAKASDISDYDKTLIKNSLSFNNKLVESIMIRIGQLETVPSDELLGPLVLNELHQTGQIFFPVSDKNGLIIGILDIRNLLTLDEKRSLTVTKVMSTEVFYIQEKQALIEALELLANQSLPTLVVKNKSGEVTGLISLSSILDELFPNTYQ